MSTATDNVIAFRVRGCEPATLIIGAVLAEEPQVVHRQFGINDRLTLREFRRAARHVRLARRIRLTKFTLKADGPAGAN